MKKCFFIKSADGVVNRVVCDFSGDEKYNCGNYSFLVTWREPNGTEGRMYIVRYKRGQYRVFDSTAFVPFAIKISFPAWDLRRIRSVHPYTLLKEVWHDG